jgi:hypothetical protein
LDGGCGTVAGVEVTCDRHGHPEESFGTDEPSLPRSAALLSTAVAFDVNF